MPRLNGNVRVLTAVIGAIAGAVIIGFSTYLVTHAMSADGKYAKKGQVESLSEKMDKMLEMQSDAKVVMAEQSLNIKHIKENTEKTDQALADRIEKLEGKH